MKPSIDPWMVQFFATIDRMDADGFAGYFAADGQFRFANHPPLEGAAAIAGGAQGIFGMLTGISHEIIKTWQADEDLLVEGRVTYHRAADQQRLAFPFLSVFEFTDTLTGPIQSYRVFVDSHELFLPASA
ncbi:MAG: nuclear transport factor 2 family protein [Wenzhouxiangella sp.]